MKEGDPLLGFFLALQNSLRKKKRFRFFTPPLKIRSSKFGRLQVRSYLQFTMSVKANEAWASERHTVESRSKLTEKRNLERNFILKVLVFTTIAVVAAVIGYVGFTIVQYREYQLYENQFDAFAAQVLPSATRG